MNEDITELLEELIDKHGILHVLTGLECVCTEKADHIRVNWQDKELARRWDRVARKIYIAANCAQENELP